MKTNSRGSLLFGIIMLLVFCVTIYVVKMQMDRKAQEEIDKVEPAPDEIMVPLEVVEEPAAFEETQEEKSEEPPPEEVKQEEPPKEEPPKEEPPKEEPPKEEPPKEEPPKEEPPKEEVKSIDSVPVEGEAEEDDDEGTFPALTCSYSKTMNFKQYAREMEKRGAVFFYFNKKENYWESFSPTFGGKNSRFIVKEIGRTYSQPRLLTDEDFSPYIKAPRDTEVFLAKTMRTENAWRERIIAALKASGIKASKLTSMRANYRLQGGRLYMDIFTVTYRKDGDTKKVSISVELP